MAEGMFIWSSENYTEVADKIDDGYGSNVTLGNIVLGIACSVINICGHIQEYIIQDLSVVVALTVHSEAATLVRSIKENDSEEHEEIPNDLWTKCQYLSDLSNTANMAFGVIWKLLHIRHLFSTTLLLLRWLKNLKSGMLNTLVALNTTKTILFYWLAVKTSAHVI